MRPFILSSVFLALIGILFFFRNEPAVKEYGVIHFFENLTLDAIVISIAGETERISTKERKDEKKFLEVLNKYAASGWSVTSTSHHSSEGNVHRTVYLERIKN